VRPGEDTDFILYEYYYTGSDRNYGKYSNPEFDRLVDLQSRTLGPEERRRIAWDAAEIALRDHVRVFTGFAQDQAILGPRVRNFLPGPAILYYDSHQRYDTVWLAE
jgi:ABC-type transport system substrate-binding protein